MMNEEKMKKAGLEYEQGLKRFAGKQPLYEKYLRNFLTDSHFDESRTACEAKDYKQALESSHALKGIAGTLGLTKLFQAASELVESIRHEEFHKVEGYFKVMDEAYKISCDAIHSLDE
ncbi:MAG: Hpt domain-containing protein [Acetivibrio sp.]